MLEALEMALWQRRGDLESFAHHAERGIRYLAIGGAERLTEAAVKPSVGPFDDALAGTIIGLYKTELFSQHGPGKGIDDVDHATMEWLDWFSHRRLLEPIGNIPPA